MKHTPTPWVTRDYGAEVLILNENLDDRVADVFETGDAERIVACVNAMAGIDNPEQWIAVAKTHMNASEAQAKQNKRLQDQLDQLGKIALAIANYVRPLEEQVNMKRTINAILGNKAGGSK
jgi:hypothetical protein